MNKTIAGFLILFAFFFGITFLLRSTLTPYVVSSYTFLKSLSSTRMKRKTQIRVGSGDVNTDNTVDFNDIKSITDLWQSSNQTPFDQYEDGQINTYDFAVVVHMIAPRPNGKGNN